MDKWVLGVTVSLLIGLFFMVVSINIETAKEISKIKADVEHIKAYLSQSRPEPVKQRKLIGEQ